VLIGVPDWLQRLVNRAVSRISSHSELRAQGLRLSQRPFTERGEVDVTVAALERTPDLARQVMLSEPYFVTAQRLLVRMDSPIVAPAELLGRTVAVVKDARTEALARQSLSGVRLHLVADHRAGLRAVERDAADAFLTEEVVLNELMVETSGRFRLIGPRLAFGLYYIDLDNDSDLQRVATSSVKTYWQIIAHRGVPDDKRGTF